MITLTEHDAVGLIEIDRTERRNALDVEHCEALRAAVDDTVHRGLRALVVTGAGSSFCAGADLTQVYDERFRQVLYAALHAVAGVGVPVIAAVNGPAIGAGTQLAVACDFRVAADGAVFGVPTARLGLAVDPWTVRRLAHVAGPAAARALLLAAQRLDVERAVACGLVDRTGDPAAALAWAGELAELAPLSLSYSKQALNAVVEPAEDPALQAAFEACWRSADYAEGRRAQAEKRTPRFAGR